jgi:hypothetical protein
MMITEDDLYAMGMESPTAWQKMQELCALAGVQFPPQPQKNTSTQKAQNEHRNVNPR